MSEIEISKIIVQILNKYGQLPNADLDINEVRYLELGLIDSISVINFIFELENEFEINLYPEDTQLNDFQTISGLARIVLGKMNFIRESN